MVSHLILPFALHMIHGQLLNYIFSSCADSLLHYYFLLHSQEKNLHIHADPRLMVISHVKIILCILAYLPAQRNKPLREYCPYPSNYFCRTNTHLRCSSPGLHVNLDVQYSVEHFSYLFCTSDSQFFLGQSYKSWEVYSLAASQHS